MGWIETNTSENGDRWELTNGLGIYCRLALQDDGTWRYRIADQTFYTLPAMPVSDAQAKVSQHLKNLLYEMHANL
jgi:hypothetical protein